MKGVLAVARREIAERRFVFAAAGVASLIPFAVPLVRGLQGGSAREARETIAALLAFAFAGGLTIALGSSVLSRDLAEGRLGFYFSRPLSGFSIWAGKMGGAFLLSIAAAAIVFLPTWAAGRGSLALDALPDWSPWAVAGGAALLLVLCHAASVALCSRSALLALDAASLLLTAYAATAVAGTLLRRMAWEPIRLGLTGFAILVGIGLAAAGIAAVVRGRNDVRAAHRALSPVLWTSLAAAVCGFAGYAAWVLAAKPADLVISRAVPAARGPWVAVEGEARGAVAGFLLDTSTGRSVRAGLARFSWQSTVFSADASLAAWFESEEPSGPFDFVTIRLGESPSRPHRMPFSVPSLPQTLVLSPDGVRAAIVSSGVLTIFETASGRALGGARIGEGASWRGFFADHDRFRVYRWGDTRLDILEFDTATRRLSRTGSVAGLQGWFYFCVAPSGRRLVVRESAGTRLRLCDARTGSLVAILAEGPPQQSSWASFLSDGRIVFATAGGEGSRLRVYSAEGSPERSIDLPPAARLALGGEVATGKLIVARRSDAAIWEGGTLYLADIDIGTARKAADGLRPLVPGAHLFAGQANLVAEVGSEGTKLFYGTGGSLVRFDPSTGERRTILRGKSKP